MKKNDVKKTPAEPPKSKENHWFCFISAKMMKTQTVQKICNNYGNTKYQKAYKTFCLLVFLLKEQGSRDGPETPGA